jgi:hypothetical protein
MENSVPHPYSVEVEPEPTGFRWKIRASLSTIIGLIAGCLASWSLVPQLLKCWREGLTEAVSKKMFERPAPSASSSGA